MEVEEIRQIRRKYKMSDFLEKLGIKEEIFGMILAVWSEEAVELITTRKEEK